MLKFFCLSVMLCTGTALSAQCASNLDPFLYCKIEGGKNEVEVCFNGVEASYRFGPVGGTPDLELNLFISQGATYFPWQGVGREISEGISFTRGRFTYATYGGFDRFTATDETVVSHFGGIRVFQDNDLIAELTCIPATVDWAY